MHTTSRTAGGRPSPQRVQQEQVQVQGESSRGGRRAVHGRACTVFHSDSLRRQDPAPRLVCTSAQSSASIDPSPSHCTLPARAASRERAHVFVGVAPMEEDPSAAAARRVAGGGPSSPSSSSPSSLQTQTQAQTQTPPVMRHHHHQQQQHHQHHHRAPTRAERMAAWQTSCTECDETLDAYSALYHLSGLGPYCEACIEADPELEGLKWEAKADFWV